MKLNKETKEKILEELRKVPIMAYAIKKYGVGRTTFYKWIKDDKKLSEDVKIALRTGMENLNDFCESKLIKKIQEENLQAIIFWLKHHVREYKQKSFIINNYKNIK